MIDEKTTDIVIVTNSPGELSSWVRVIAEDLKIRARNGRIIIALVPCPYATGKEEQIASDYPFVDFVIPPSKFISFALFGKYPEGFIPSKVGIVVFLGGSFWHAAMVARKLKYPAVAYVAGPFAGWEKDFKYIFCPYDQYREGIIKKGVHPDKVKVVGNLICDGIRTSIDQDEVTLGYKLDFRRLTIGIFPGSRLFNMQDSLPVMLKVADEIRQEEPNVQFILGLSPFISLSELEDTVKDPKSPIPGASGEIIEEDGIKKIITQNGTQVTIFQSNRYDMINTSDFIITIPGTNTAECACLGKPVIVIYSWKARFPSGWPGSMINILPLGKLRRKLMFKIMKKFKFGALPNLIAQKAIVPEVQVEDSSEEVTKIALKMIRDGGWRENMSRELKRVIGESGATQKINEVILDILDEQEFGTK